MIGVQEEKNIYLSNFLQFEKELAADGNSPVHRLRKAAMKRFTELGFPTTRNEDWKFTNVASIARVPFRLADRQDNALSDLELKRVAPRIGECHRLVFMNGHYVSELSSAGLGRNLAAFLDIHPEWVEPYLARYADYDNHAFTALNTAFLRDGAFLHIPKGEVIERPIHLVFLSTASGEPAVCHPRTLIVAGESSQATIVESYLGTEDSEYFTNAVTEI